MQGQLGGTVKDTTGTAVSGSLYCFIVLKFTILRFSLQLYSSRNADIVCKNGVKVDHAV